MSCWRWQSVTATRDSSRESIQRHGIELAASAKTKNAVAGTLRHIDLAAEIGSPRLRIFGGRIPKEVSRGQAANAMVAAMRAI